MRTTLLIGLAATLVLFGCSKDRPKANLEQPAEAGPKDESVAAPNPQTGRTTATPTPTGDDGLDDFAKAVISALGHRGSAKLVELTLKSADIRPLLETGLKNCPEKMPPGATIDEGVSEMGKMLGSDAERATTYAGYHAACAKVGDFANATFKSATAKDRVLECGGGSADRLVIEVELESKSVFVVVDDPIKTKDGWKMPESIVCSTTSP